MVCGGYLKVSELFRANLQSVVYLATSCAFCINSVTYFLYVIHNERVNRGIYAVMSIHTASFQLESIYTTIVTST